MTLRSAALAGVALVALVARADAGEGWYLGLGAGWDNQYETKLNEFVPPPAVGFVQTHDGLILAGSVGYKMPDIPLRLEFESGFDWHSVDGFKSGGTYDAYGHSDIASELFNAVYDLPIAPAWNIELGAGAGAGHLHLGSNITHTGNEITQLNRWGFMWQAIGGMSYEINPQVDLFVDYRYRDAQAHGTSWTPAFGPVGSHPVTENVVLAGLRWYPAVSEPPPPPPPPAPPPPPPPPPPAPPPVKTFIVFFDFNQSNLTAEAEQVVAEAVKTAKETGQVRVLVTGHTDTVGSDSYNQGLSVRRAESVKDEMVREGMEGSEISIQGKSFHDPLVPTGPGVREPQNRRAVIDLGGS